MQSMTLEQLRAASDAGGVSDVVLKGQGGAFLVQIDTRSGGRAVLTKARSTEPRRFGNPAAALSVLREVGITVGRFDASAWQPAEKQPAAGTRGRADVLREAHRSAAYNRWLAGEIQGAIDDPRPNIPHDEVMADMDADRGASEVGHAPTRTRRA
ncbi:hypothetical protein P7L78_26680 [Tistrella bauzanensis]|jgi:hypothetical protein|uniref:Stability determinant domain-containing protein n=1 Tax=Tistrella arctica TaxID=3133430 RepID=A0ABU9YH97_9PROT